MNILRQKTNNKHMCISVELDQAFYNAESVNVYNEGELCSFDKEKEQYKKILDGFLSLIEGAHEMPAYGVSLNRETLRELENGLWLEFVFNEQYQSNGLPFEKLLINVQSSFYGFNIIRYNNQCGYDGRCFYYDLVSKDMSSLYDLLLNL